MGRIILKKWKVVGKPVVVSMFGILMLLSASQVVAQTETAVPAVQFGLIGIARAQTARLNVINLHPPNPGLPPSPIEMALFFLDENGEIFLDRAGNPVAIRAEILPGQSAFLELRAADAFAGSTAPRRQFRGLIEGASWEPTYPPNPCEGLVATLEIYDNFTGRTMVLYEKSPGPVQKDKG